LGVADDQREAFEREQHAKRGHERADADDGREDAVDQSNDHREHEARHQAEPPVVDLVEQERREQVDRADRQVDLSVIIRKTSPAARIAERREVRQQRLEVLDREERVRGRGEVHRDHDRDDNDAALAERQESPPPAQARARAHLRRALGPRRLAAGLDGHGYEVTPALFELPS
jgi:hypothetical protein